MTRIVLVRHGQTEWNQVERFRGQADVPLDETGLAQAEVTAHRVAAEWYPVAIYSSPLSRAVRTAEAIARYFDLPVQIHHGLTDINYGQWQGLTPDEAKERWPKIVDAWYRTPTTVHIPGGETLSHLRVRVMEAIRELAARHQGTTIIVVGHTVVNRAILLGLLGLSNHYFWRLRQDTCAINVLDVDDEDFTLVSMNDTCHLRGQLG